MSGHIRPRSGLDALKADKRVASQSATSAEENADPEVAAVGAVGEEALGAAAQPELRFVSGTQRQRRHAGYSAELARKLGGRASLEQISRRKVARRACTKLSCATSSTCPLSVFSEPRPSVIAATVR